MHSPVNASEHSSVADSLREALPCLLAAEKDYECLDILEALQDVQYFISVIYHNLDMVNERDMAARRHHATAELRKKLATTVFDDEVEAILDLIGRIGVALTSRK
jgi:anaphase-promoting complex subunit 5